MTDRSGTDLPRAVADRFTGPRGRFLQAEEVASGLPLRRGVIAALELANSPWSAPFLRFWKSPVVLRIGPLEFRLWSCQRLEERAPA